MKIPLQNEHKQKPFVTTGRLTGAKLGLVMSGVFLSTMDSGMVNVALPSIMRALQLSLEDAGMVVTVYLMTVTVTLVLWGALADRWGTGRIYLSGMLLFGLGSGLCWLSSSYVELLSFRTVQAVGAAMMMSAGPAIIKAASEKSNLGRNLGLVGVATACGLLLGPVVSGFIVTSFSWRAIFLVAPLLCSVGLLAGLRVFRNIPGIPSGPYSRASQYDWLGSFGWACLVISLTITLRQLGNPGPLTVIFSVLTLILGTLFFRIEQRAKRPLLPLQIARQKFFWIAVVTAVLSFLGLFSVMVLVPFYLEFIREVPVARVGSVLTSVPATLIILSPLSGWLYDRIGARLLTMAGLALSCLALLSLITLDGESSMLSLWIRLMLLGAGQSIFLSPNSASVLSRIESAYLGVTSGILATARNLGMVAGATFATAIFSGCFSLYTAGKTLDEFIAADASAFLFALRITLAMCGTLLFIASVLSFFRGGNEAALDVVSK